MHDSQVHFLSVLADEGNLADAARRCAVSAGALRSELQAMESQYGQPLLTSAFGDATLTPAGQRLLGWMQDFGRQCEVLRDDIRQQRQVAALAPLASRRSVSPRRLEAPAPTDDEIAQMIAVAACGPDHGSLRPWRVIGFDAAQREPLAALFEAEKLRRDPLAPAPDLLRARDHATRAPALLAFVVSPRQRHAVPVREQWLAAGAALGNLLNAAHQLGYGAIVLSGERCHDGELLAALGIERHEFLAGFISLGTISRQPPAREPTDAATLFSRWMPGAVHGHVPAPGQPDEA